MKKKHQEDYNIRDVNYTFDFTKKKKNNDLGKILLVTNMYIFLNIM